MKTDAQTRLKEIAGPNPKPGSEEWFLGLDPAKQKDYLTKNPTSRHAKPHKTKLKLKHRAKKGLATKAKKKALNGLTPRTGLATAALDRLSEVRAAQVPPEVNALAIKINEVLLKNGFTLNRIRQKYNPDGNEISVCFMRDMDEVPDKVIDALVALSTKKLQVEPCKDAHGSGLINVG